MTADSRLPLDFNVPTPRYYQEDAIQATLRDWERYNNLLLVIATGLGKTVLFSELARRLKPATLLVLAHRDELITQGHAALEKATGEYVGIEQGSTSSHSYQRVVMGSVTSVCQPGRLARMGRKRFDYVVVDEAHHSAARTYGAILDWFDAKGLGVTATADRSDGKALGRRFDHVSYRMDILDGIEQGYLVPIKGRRVALEEVDLTHVRTMRGDLNLGELDETMLAAVEGICHKVMEICPERKGIGFFPGIKSAEYAQIRMNRLRPGSAGFVCGQTDQEDRRRIVADYKRGALRYLFNCGVAVEGFDAPDTDLIIHGRPTESRSLFTQMSGRGTRVLPGLVDRFPGRGEAGQRRAAIESSDKPNLLLMDFVGHAGRHTLISPIDMLEGKKGDREAISRAKDANEDSGGEEYDVEEMLKNYRFEMERFASQAQAREASIQATEADFDPFAPVELEDGRIVPRRLTALATSRQIFTLQSCGYSAKELATMSRRKANLLISGIIESRRRSQSVARSTGRARGFVEVEA